MAQAYREGNLLETVEAVTSQDILLNGTGNMGGGQYLCGQGYSSTVTKDCRYRLEQVSGQVDGLNLYVLKQVSTGLYVKDYTLQTTDDDQTSQYDTSDYPFGGYGIAVTADKAEAMQFTVSLAVENGTDPRSKTTQGQAQDLSQPSFVLATKQPSANGSIQFLGHYYKPFYAVYEDTNAWQIHAVDEPQGKEKLQAYMDAYFANNTDPAVTYLAGTYPGACPAELVEAAHAAYTEANAALNADEFTLTDEQVNDLCNRIESSIEKLKTSTNPMVDGIYFIHDSRYVQCGQHHVPLWRQGQWSGLYQRQWQLHQACQARRRRCEVLVACEIGKWRLSHCPECADWSLLHSQDCCSQPLWFEPERKHCDVAQGC